MGRFGTIGGFSKDDSDSDSDNDYYAGGSERRYVSQIHSLIDHTDCVLK